MLNSEKQDRARSDKQVEKLEGELSMLRKDRERLQGLVSQYEKELIDLKEQVDAALGAEEMVEQLTERNLKLEDEIREILEEKNDLVSRSEMWAWVVFWNMCICVVSWKYVKMSGAFVYVHMCGVKIC